MGLQLVRYDATARLIACRNIFGGLYAKGNNEVNGLEF